jgi:hypothetical protein
MIFALETATPRLQISTGREARVSSAGAAAASAAARRCGAASRKATLQARAPEEDTLADRPRDDLKTRD